MSILVVLIRKIRTSIQQIFYQVTIPYNIFAEIIRSPRGDNNGSVVRNKVRRRRRRRRGVKIGKAHDCY